MSAVDVLANGSHAGTTELDRLRAQVAALEQLLEVHEQTSLEASARLERSIHERDKALALERASREARDRALATASAERQRLHDVFMQAPAAITVLEGADHRFSVVNPLYRRLVGGRDVLGLTVREALPELEGQGFYELLDHVYATGQPFVANEMLVRLDRDGTGELKDLWIDFVYQPLTAESGEVVGIMAHAVETTEHVLARQRVEALATERAAILGQIADAVITVDTSGRITFVNAAAQSTYGAVREGVAIWDPVQPFTLLEVDGTPKPRERVPLARAIRGERVLNEEWRVRRADGSECRLLGSAVPLAASDGRLFGAAMSVRDVTVSRRLERELDVERTRLREVLMQAPAAISVTEGPDHVIAFQNTASMQLVGGRDLTGMRAIDALPDAEVRPLLAIVDAVYASGEAFVGNEVHVRFDRTGAGDVVDGYFNLVYQPLRDAEGHVHSVLSHSVDVTEQVVARKEVEEKAAQLARLTRELEQSNRDLDQFAYVASHDLKAPLRGIANLTQWIEDDLGPNVTGESREHMHLLKGRVHRMEALIEGILTYSRAGRVRDRDEQLDAGALVREVIELLAPPDGVDVTLAGAFPTMVAERVPLQQVLMNLIGNAIKHCRMPGARVAVSATAGPTGFVQFDVSDNGPGIPAQYQERIWEIFQMLAPRDRVEGTGIGLSVVRKLVEARGGRAWVDSVEGQGATFHFTWPERPRTIA